MKKKIVIIAISVILVFLVTAAVIVIASEDRTAPIITVNIPIGHDITYLSGEDKGKLIQYAKAIDDIDGDVSNSIKIEDVYPTSDLSKVKVIYVARDKSNNIARFSQLFNYIPSEEEIDNLTNLNEKATSGTNAANSTNVSATNATSIKAQDSTKAAIAVSTKPVLSLTQSEATITQGDIFNVVLYIKDITDDKDSRSSLFTRIIVTGYDASNADTSKVGNFSMSIYCIDADGNLSNTVKFVLHVKAKKVDDTITEKPTETSTEKPTEKATEKSTEASTEKSTETSTEKQTEAPTVPQTLQPVV